MFNVEFIKPGIKGRVIIGINSCDKTVTVSISSVTYSKYYFLKKGSSLDEELFNAFILEDEEYRAMKKALYLLSYSDKNRRTLYMKLLQNGFSREIVEKVVKDCLRLGYIDEKRQLERLITNEANRNLKGPNLIFPKMLSKGYSAQDVDFVLHRLCCEGEIDFNKNLLLLFEKKHITEEEDKKAFAYKNGFKYNL